MGSIETNMAEGVMTPDDLIGGLDPIVGAAVTGWTIRGTRVFLKNAEDVILSEAVADLPRQFVDGYRTEDVGGFSLTLPDAERNVSQWLRVTTASDYTIPGSPILHLGQPIEGKVEAVQDNVIYGYICAPLSDEGDPPLTIVATAGDEQIAVAAAQPAETTETVGRIRRFAVILPPDLASVGHRIVHVAIVGASSRLHGSPAVLPRMPRRSITLLKQRRPITLAIKIAAPNIRVAHEWGDYHFARQIGAALQRRGWVTRVDCQDEWQRTGDDATLALRGRHRYPVDRSAINMMWQISHPDRMPKGETLDYDHIFVASDIYARQLDMQTPTPVSVLHQATDPSVFHPPVTPMQLDQTLLFVGNSRREYRTFVKWCVEADLDLAVFGSYWNELIPDRYVLGSHINNTDLHKWYGSCGILLNDHWDTMKDSGFLSNRLFDGSAAGAFIITDPVRGLAKIFGDTIEVARDAQELYAKVAYYKANPEERLKRAEAARKIVLSQHTFDHRAETIATVYEAIAQKRSLMGDAVP